MGATLMRQSPTPLVLYSPRVGHPAKKQICITYTSLSYLPLSGSLGPDSVPTIRCSELCDRAVMLGSQWVRRGQAGHPGPCHPPEEAPKGRRPVHEENRTSSTPKKGASGEAAKSG